MFKKVFSILVLVSVVGLVLGGCGKAEETTDTPAAGSTETTAK